MRRLFILLLTVALAWSGAPATAHREVVESPENPDAKRVDIESVEVTHPGGVVQFVVTFRNPHPMGEPDRSPGFVISMRTKRTRPTVRRVLSLRGINPDGSIVAQFRNPRTQRWLGFANVYSRDERTLVVEFHRQQLRWTRLARVMDWTMFAIYEDEEDECPREEGDVFVPCTDTIPESLGPDIPILHRFGR